MAETEEADYLQYLEFNHGGSLQQASERKQVWLFSPEDKSNKTFLGAEVIDESEVDWILKTEKGEVQSLFFALEEIIKI